MIREIYINNMGGKTQQRVAGNVKPTNSGRIRGLLVNQQLATGNVITFSALSSKNEQSTQSLRGKPEQVTTNDNELSATIVDPLIESQVHPPSSTPIKDNTKLVLRRVGNRELYTRVRLTDKDALHDSAVEPSKAGVKKPSYLVGAPKTAKDSNNEETLEQSIETKNTNDSENIVECQNDQLLEIDPYKNLAFEDILDKLMDKVTLADQSVKASKLNELNEFETVHEVELVNLYNILLQKFSKDLSLEDWDLMNSSLNKWIKWITQSNYPLGETHQAELCTKIFGFIHHLIIFSDSLKHKSQELEDLPMLQTLIDDWTNFRSSSMFLNLIDLFLKLIKLRKTAQLSESVSSLDSIIEALAHIIVSVDPRVVLSNHNITDYLDSKVSLDLEFKPPKGSIICNLDEKKFRGFIAISGLLKQSDSRVIIVTAHAILNKVVASVCENVQSSTLIADHEDVDDILIYPPVVFMAALTFRDSIMSALLSDYRVGDISVTIEPNTDAYVCTLAYLLAWDLTIHFIVGVDKEVGQCMIHSLKKIGLIQRLLDNIFMLLPPLDDRSSLDFRVESSIRDTAASETRSWNMEEFLKSPLMTTIKRPVNEIELIALHLYFSVALHMPVTVRKWFNNNSNKRLCNLVNEYTVKHISQLICSLEMDSVQAKCQERANRDESNNLIIKARPSAKEVYAIYTRDEFKMELTIKLPLNYPLGPVQIDGGKRVGVTDLKWRSWLLQLTTFLAHQNGPILDGIDLWRKNIDKRFEGVEKCTICFSILHSNYQLPKKRCQTCANMFHNICLYKWFESSGNSTCPLCRNPW